MIHKATYKGVADQLDVHKRAVEKDWPEEIRTSEVLLCLIGPAEKLPTRAAATFLTKRVAYLSWRKLEALVLDPASETEKAIEADLHRALNRWAEMKNGKKGQADL